MKKTKNLVITQFVIILTYLFAFNTSYSQVTDKDGNEYKTVTISTKEWMAENLKVERYRNGDLIPQVQDEKEWNKLTTGAWCYFENKTENGVTYGKLYNWYAVNDPRGLAPEGWHVATEDDWKNILEYLGGNADAGGKMKSTELWQEPNKQATNESGFTALPGGFREDGRFKHILKWGCFWTSTQINTVAANSHRIIHNETNVIKDSNHKRNGLSVRCVKD